MEVSVAARYPFLKESSKYLRDQGVTLDQLVSSMAYERARFQGRERVFEVLYDGSIDDHPLTSKVDAANELLSYPVARMIVSAVADPWFVKRYAIAEGKKANDRLRLEDPSFVIGVAEELGLVVGTDDGAFAVHFSDFLRFSSSMRSKPWKLVNQRVRKGRVLVDQRKLVRIVEQMITDKIASELPLEVTDEILDRFSKEIEEIRAELDKKRKEQRAEGMGRLSILSFPPCMKHLLEMTRGGENVPHSGRFALVAFLHTLGMDSDEILQTFSSAPDFDESKSRYQVDHITGEISGTEYTPPECSTMKSYGICFNPDGLCRKIKHPLSYYRAKGRALRSRK